MLRARFRHTFEVTLRTLRRDGLSGVLSRSLDVLSRRWGSPDEDVWLFEADITHSSLLDLPEPSQGKQLGTPLRIGWVCTPPAFGSGGHTTMLRMVQALEEAGHDCTLFFYDWFEGSLERHEQVLRTGWPEVRARVANATAGITGVDLAIASSWESAHVLASRGKEPMYRAYFIQDYEPYFFPRGWTYELAADTYRFGFRCIALGPMVAETLWREAGVSSEMIEFGSDVSSYHLLDPGTRRGVVFFARPGLARRGFDLGIAALAEFHRINPQVEIHVYGGSVTGVSFPVTQHGKLSPKDLNSLYNRCVAGLCLSFTNVSLVPEEMLAAGLIPVCNDTPFSRYVLHDPQVSWVAPLPSEIAHRLDELTSADDIFVRAQAAANGVRRGGWTAAQKAVVTVCEGIASGKPS